MVPGKYDSVEKLATISQFCNQIVNIQILKSPILSGHKRVYYYDLFGTVLTLIQIQIYTFIDHLK